MTNNSASTTKAVVTEVQEESIGSPALFDVLINNLELFTIA